MRETLAKRAFNRDALGVDLVALRGEVIARIGLLAVTNEHDGSVAQSDRGQVQRGDRLNRGDQNDGKQTNRETHDVNGCPNQ